MLAQSRWIKTTQFPSVIVIGVVIFLIAYLTLLSPAGLEEDFSGVRVVHPKDLLSFIKSDAEPNLAKGVPTDVTPAYSLRNFDYFSTTENRPQFKFSAKKSNFYQKEQLVHGKDPVVTLSDGTVITSKESLYDTAKNEIDFYGDVVTTFNNGVVTHSNYMKAVTKPILTVTIPLAEPVSGEKAEKKGAVTFKSYGLNFVNAEPKELRLMSRVVAKVSGDRTTQVQSDLARMDFVRNKLYFFMNDQRTFDQQFVRAHQAELEMKSRTIEMDLKDSKINTISGLGDVSIWDKSFYSTSGKAILIEKTNQIQLSDFPQVYQGADTITGDLIIYNRTEDTIEVKQSNAIYKH